jgi:long-chain acyl-CoA synthetase
MTAVPRLYEALHDRITRGVAAKGGVTQRLFEQAIFLGKKQQSGLSLGVFEQIQNKCLDVLVRRKVRARFGGRLAYFVSGGAALNSEIGTFFLALGVNILQGYGQTEASPLVSANRPSKIRIDTVGPAVRGVSVKIAADGELLVQGACVMKGYWRDDDATAEALRDGWLYTGDLAKIEDDGYITIRGRKKDIIVTSGGDNIAPAKIEAALTFMPEIEQVMIYGDKKAWLSAVIVPSEAEGRAPDTVKQDISRCIDAVNKTVPQAEKIRRFLMADEPFTTENGQMTPTLKVKRLVVTDIYLERLNALYKKS